MTVPMEQRRKTCRKLRSEVIRTQGCSWFTELNRLTKQDLVEVQFWLKKWSWNFCFVMHSVALFHWQGNLNLRTLKLGICWCGFSCPCQCLSPFWFLSLGFCSLGTQKMSVRHVRRCWQRQVVNCNMFKSEEILNLHICLLLLLLPCKPKPGFHYRHQTKNVLQERWLFGCVTVACLKPCWRLGPHSADVLCQLVQAWTPTKEAWSEWQAVVCGFFLRELLQVGTWGKTVEERIKVSLQMFPGGTCQEPKGTE